MQTGTSQMWKILLIVVIIVAAVVLFIKKNDGVVASGHPEWPPIMYQDGEVIKGAGPALVAKIFAELDVPVTFPYAGAWDEVQAKAKSGKVDVLVAAYKTTEREEYMAYSEPYTTDPVAVFVKTGKDFIFGKNEDLIGKKGVGMIGDSYGQVFDDFVKSGVLSFETVATAEDAFALIRENKADFFVYSLYAGQKELGLTTQEFAILPRFVAEESFYITISKKSSYLKYLPEINRLIGEYKANGTIDALIAEYKQDSL